MKKWLVFVLKGDCITCRAPHGPLPNASGQKLLPGLVCEWLNEPRPSVPCIL